MAETDVHNFVQYNVLSPDLASPSHYEKSPPEALTAEVRQEKILAKLLPHTQCVLKRATIVSSIALRRSPFFHAGIVL